MLLGPNFDCSMWLREDRSLLFLFGYEMFDPRVHLPVNERSKGMFCKSSKTFSTLSLI